jgi:glycosyltransferase involved in cell wall biosynthesis
MSASESEKPEGGTERPLVSVVVPVYNEMGTIKELLQRVAATPVEKEIIVVDDGSTDGTPREVEKLAIPNVRLIRHEKNRGKGAAVRTGFAEARGRIILIQDADLEYDPSNYEALLAPILADKADVVYGSRFLGGPHRVLYFWHYVANKALTLMSNVLSNLNLSDMETGHKVFRREVIEGLKLREDGFGIEPELTQKVAKRRWRVYEVPIAYYGRTYEEGKKIRFRHALEAAFCLLRYAFFD